MARKLDFNSIVKPVLEITMRDAAHTVIRVTTPNEGLIEKLTANSDQLNVAVNTGTAESIEAVFTLMADFVNCNLDGIKVTAEELRDKYALTLYDVTLFYNAYREFIEEIRNAKN